MSGDQFASQAASQVDQQSGQLKYQLAAAAQLKQEGNKLHGAKRFREAAEKYERAVSNLQGGLSRWMRLRVVELVGWPHDTRLASCVYSCRPCLSLCTCICLHLPLPAGHTSQQSRELRISCQSNLASCFLQLERWRECVDMCGTVLALESSNRKALYRRGAGAGEKRRMASWG